MFTKPKEVPNPIKWRFNVKKVTEHLYHVHLTAFIEPSWRLYSQQSHPEGPMPTTILFDQNDALHFIDTPQEVGTLKEESNNQVVTKYYTYAVDFVQEVIIMAEGQTISGKVIYRPHSQYKCIEVCETEFDVLLA
jgi:thiol:disulfide interchange protein DsbD